MNYSYCSDLEKCLQDTCSVLVSVHETISFYIDKPFYGRLLGDLERKQAQFLDILDRVQGEGEKSFKTERGTGNLVRWPFKFDVERPRGFNQSKKHK